MLKYVNCNNFRMTSYKKTFKNLLIFEKTFNFFDISMLPSVDASTCILLPWSRRIMLISMFVLKILNGNIPSDFLISSIRINVPFNYSRYYQLLYTDFYRTNYSMGEPLSKICVDFNSVYCNVDFGMSLEVIKSRIILFLNN